jgi:ABC-type Na+ efflux pump permease subunit
MRKALLVAWREYSEAVKSKGFLVGIAMAPLLMFGGIIVQMATKDKVDTRDQHFAVVDHTGRLGHLIVDAAKKHNDKDTVDKEGKKTRPAYIVELVTPKSDLRAQQLELSDQVRADKYRAFIEIGDKALSPTGDGEQANATYHSERAAMDDARFWFNGTLNDIVRGIRMKELNVDPVALGAVLKPISVDGVDLLSVDQGTGNVTGGKKRGEAEAFMIPFAALMLMYMMVMFGSMPQIHAVMEEKNQRIAEVLLGSLSPFELMIGKLIGNLGIALTTTAVYIVGGAIAIAKMGVADSVPIHLVPWFIVYLVLAIAMYGAASIAVGSAVNDAKEAQSLTFSILLPLIVPMFLMMPIIKEPNGLIANVVSFFPPCTPLTMLLRQAVPGGIPAWQPWVGLIGLFACTVLCVWAAGRIFRIGLLSQGKTPKISELIRWAIRG